MGIKSTAQVAIQEQPLFAETLVLKEGQSMQNSNWN